MANVWIVELRTDLGDNARNHNIKVRGKDSPMKRDLFRVAFLPETCGS